MSRSIRMPVLLGILLILAMVLAACPAQQPAQVVEVEVTRIVEGESQTVVVTATPEPAAPAEPSAVTVNYNWGTEPPTADPALTTDTTSSSLIGSIFTGLTDIDDATKEAVPALASGWESNADATEWTFTLRDDVPWVQYNPSSGETELITNDEGSTRMVNAHDVVYGIKRTLDPNTGSQYAYILYPIAGAEEFNNADPAAEGFQELMDGVGVEAVDDWTVKFTLAIPAGFWPQVTSMANLFPQPQWIIDDKGDRWIEPGFIVTNGAYVMTEWVHGDHLSLARNPHWPFWGSDYASGNIEKLYGVMIEEASTAFALYEDNELDTAGVPLDQIDRVKADAELGTQLVNAPINCTYYYGFVTTKGPTADANVRRALSMAVDRKTLVDQVTKGGQIPANTFTNPLNFGSAAEDSDVAEWALTEDKGGSGYAAALESAKTVLADAGYPEGAGLEVLIMHNVSEGHARIAQAIQAMWQTAFPQMTATIETQEWRVYLQTIDKDSPLEDQPNVFRLGWCGDYPHANNWLHEVFNTDAGANRVRLSTDDPQVGDLVAQYNELTVAAQTASEEEAAALYKQAEQLLIDEIAAIVPIYYYTTVNTTKPWLQRSFDPIQMHLYQWTLDMDAKVAGQ